MTKPPSRTKNRGGGFIHGLRWMYFSYDKFYSENHLTYDK